MVWIILAVVIVAVLLFAMAKKKRPQNSHRSYPYRKRLDLFTPAERSFLGVLEQAVGDDFRLFGKVRVADVLEPRDGLNRSAWQSAFNKINRKHFDFVLCAPGDLSVLCAIELDDKSHQRKHRHDRDEFLAGACRAAGIPLISFPAQHAYVASEVSARIAEALADSSVRLPKRAEIAVIRNPPRQLPRVTPEKASAPICPRCSNVMIRRMAEDGESAGREFWGCSNSPICHETVTL